MSFSLPKTEIIDPIIIPIIQYGKINIICPYNKEKNEITIQPQLIRIF